MAEKKWYDWTMREANEWAEEAQKNWLIENVWEPFKQAGYNALDAMWDGFVGILPDLMGYGAMLTGALAILYTLAGRGMIKPLGVYGGLLIVGISILAVN